jgi:hypothetical protein
MRGSRIAADEPSDCCKQDAQGYAAHQHADKCSRAAPTSASVTVRLRRRSLPWRSCLPRSKARIPKMRNKAGDSNSPKNRINQYSMQNDYGGCEPHNEYGRAKRPRSVKIIAKILPDLCNSKAELFAPRVPAGAAGTRGDSRDIGVQNDKRCPRRARLSALSHRDAEPNPKPPAKTRFTCDTCCE